MDAVKLREKAEKLLAMAKEQERKEREMQQKKIATLVLEHVKAKGYEFGPDFAAKVKAIMEPGSVAKTK
jgi:hypothetical protein